MKNLGFFLGVLLFLGCAQHVVEKPKNLIPKEKMIDILHDLSLLNATRSTLGARMDETGIEVMGFLYDRYDIDSLQFVQSDLYYASRPLEYQALFTEVDARLDARTKALEEAAEKRNDSIREATEKRNDSIDLAKKQDSIKPEGSKGPLGPNS